MMNLGNVFILGDSYSTFDGYVPEGHIVYYDKTGAKGTDVRAVEQTWWHQLIAETESQLLMNNSFSGTTICNTGYEGEDYSDKSFIARLDNLIQTGYFKDNKVDTFFVFGGTNDSWAGSPLGELMYSSWGKEDLYKVFPAFSYLLSRIKSTLPDTRIIVILNSELKDEIDLNFKTACDNYGVELIELENIDKENGHPVISGMKQIKDQVLEYLSR